MAANDTTNLDLAEELDKVKNVLGALWSKIPHASEEEANGVTALIDSIGTQPVAEESATETTSDAETSGEDTATDPLAEMSIADLEAELAKRQAEAPTGSGS